MIEELHIKNLGVIANASIDFTSGLTVLTGETGAGKTMLLTSLQLLLGQRADTGKIRAGATEATVDGVFSLTEEVRGALENAEIETDEPTSLIIGRKIGLTRSRAYLEQRPAPLNLLTEIGPHLAVIHGQAEQLNLRNANYQRELLDSFGDETHQQLVEQYRQAWKRAVTAKRTKDQFEDSLADAETEIAQLRPVVDKIQRLSLEVGEEETLSAEIKRIENAEQLHQGLATAHGQFGGGENLGIVEALGVAGEALGKIAELDEQVEGLAGRVRLLLTEAQTLRDDLAYVLHEISADPAKLDALQSRKRAINQLLRGRAVDIAGLLEWVEKTEQRLEGLEKGEVHLEQLAADLAQAQQEVLRIGAKLSAGRQSLAKELEQSVDLELHGLAMPNAHFMVQLSARTRPGPEGLEDVEMLLQAHPDLSPAPLGAGASGGELSRIMLALEVVLADRQAQNASGLTYIFDEIDAGIGGSAAREVGARLARLAKHRQVIVVTHLAQVAAWADQQLVIEKNGATTTVQEVVGQERVAELARMLSGAADSQTAQAHALELLEYSQQLGDKDE
ncbi:DNA repair protein RecN [Gleimia sp. 6138-11-ORH1]|uniref:DNA repair protein RecN n=1 Tax=Gleimia sp. 6138-11-ORH1 TaxID=2973937 RepID=UPI00216726DD|nr:DNA repair protein RecN [Gleimia sp. 6138-11-ORH1]MCS4484563.1 DNA repair protein RecN [Gleimia sp. 6138-11-ORH1]